MPARRLPLLCAGALLALAGCQRPPGPPPGLLAVTVRGHEEGILGPGAGITPLLVDREGELALCLETEPALDTSQWQARLHLRGAPPAGSPFAPPFVRMESTLCFAWPGRRPDGPGAVELCAELRDAFDGATYTLPCVELRVDPDPARRAALVAHLRELLGAAAPGGTATLVASLDRLAGEARSAGYPFLATRLDLVAVYYLRRTGTPAAIADAARRLARPRPWLARPEAALWAAQVAQERAAMALAAGPDLRRAWQYLHEADDAYRLLAHPKRFTVAMQQAEILGRVGALREAVDRLRTALDACADTPCEPGLLDPARGTLAWLVLLDPLSTEAELAAAEGFVRQSLTRTDARADSLEHANQLVNLAYLEVRLGRDPRASLEQARRLLARSPSGTRRRQLEGVGALVEAERQLRLGRGDHVLATCLALARDAPGARERAWALSCVGRARRRTGDLEGAAEAFDRALLMHEHATPAGLGQAIAIGPGQRAEDFYRAARLAVERGRAAEAWDLLTRLDRTALGAEGDEPCGGAATPAGGSPGTDPGAVRREELLAQLAALELPAAGARRAQRETIRRALLSELRELDRSPAGCAGAAVEGPAVDADYRAVALEDEILLLARSPAGEVSLARRSPLPRPRLAALLAAADEALATGDLEDADWRRLLAPVATALAPTLDAAPGVTSSYALHGLLQAVPLAALPLPGGTGWFAERGAVAQVPAGLRRRPATPARHGTRALFIVDPRRNLPSGGTLAALYGRLFPWAQVLSGPAATRSAVRAALAGVDWLHLDTHGRYDPAFPELSRLELADAEVDLGEISSWEAPVALANLSGCDTGRWPATADSGRYGLGGLFARRGASWVVASRAPLDDGVARRFNEAFYQALGRDGSVPQAFRQALVSLAAGERASRWGALLLLVGGGQSGAVVTPVKVEDIGTP